jgi:hypothetical protein
VTFYKDHDYEKEAEPTENDDEGAALGAKAYDDALFEILKTLRKKIAKEKNLPPYVIFQDPSLEVLVPTTETYYLTAGNGNCSYTDSISITVFSESISISGPDSICLNSPTLYTAINNSQEVFSYVWSPAAIIQGATNQATATILPQATQYLYVEATSANGCIVEDSVYVTVSYINPTLVQASATPPLVTPGSTISLSGAPSGYPIYQWVPAAPVLNPNAQNTQASLHSFAII